MNETNYSESNPISHNFSIRLIRISKIIVFSIMFGVTPVFANQVQPQRTINGTVTDDGDFPLMGVSIIVKGTNVGTITNYEGKYTLQIPENAELLIFSFIGMTTQKVILGSENEINIVMTEATTGLDEIIVVGYGTQSNQKVSAAISQVSGRELEIAKRPVVNTQQALIGAIPGLTIDQTRGQPGAEVDIFVRETSALATEGRGAMVLIDGFAGSFSDVSPNDIESVSVLKDAAATAIYGARGANGVVLITTKKTRRNEKLKLTYSFNHSSQRPASTPQMSNSLEFMEFLNEANLNETLINNPGTNPSTVNLPFSSEEISKAQSGFYPETQWLEELYSEDAGQTMHNLGINGGSMKTGYLINFSSLNQNGLAVGSDNLKRYNLRVKIDTDITEWLTVGTNVSLTNRDIQKVPINEGNGVRGRPFFPVQLEDGTFVNKGAAGIDNPVGNAQSGSYDITKRDGLNLQMYATLKPIKGLTLEQRVSFDRTNEFQEIWQTPYEIALMDMDLNVTSTISPVAANRSLLMRSSRADKLNALTTILYKYSLDNQHNFNTLLGFQTEQGESIQVEAERFNFILPTLQDLKLGQEINGLGNSSDHGGNRTTMSYFGRLGYDFKGKYLVELNLRADASSNFGPNNKWGYFPAVSLGWNVKDEAFLDQVGFIEALKLRASWGLSGDDGSINVIENALFNPSGYSLGGVLVPTLELGRSINPDLKWETSEKINIGVDFELADGLFGLSTEYYIDKRKNIITELLTSEESGLGGVLDNVYDAKVWGWEFDLTHKNNIGKFRYNTFFNLTFYNSEITNSGGVSPLNNSATNYQDVGLPIRGNWYGYKVEGLFNDEADISEWNVDQSAVSAGDAMGRYLGGFKYIDQITVDTDGDGIPDAVDGVINADDRVVLRTNTGDNFRVGFGLGASYEGFSLSARFYGVLKGLEWWRSSNITKIFPSDVASYTYQTDAWRPDNQDALFPRATASDVLYDTDVDYFIHENSYIKLQNVSLSYTFNKNLCRI